MYGYIREHRDVSRETSQPDFVWIYPGAADTEPQTVSDSIRTISDPEGESGLAKNGFDDNAGLISVHLLHD